VDKGNLGAQFHNVAGDILFWENGTATSNFDYNGEIAVLRFEILAPTLGTQVTVSYDKTGWDIFDINFNRVDFDVIDGMVSTPVVLESITIDSQALTSMARNTSKEINCIITPGDAAVASIVWTSSNENIAYVKDGRLVVAAIGNAVITCTVTSVYGTVIRAVIAVRVS